MLTNIEKEVTLCRVSVRSKRELVFKKFCILYLTVCIIRIVYISVYRFCTERDVPEG